MDSRNPTKTIILKSPDSDKVREVIVTSVLLPKTENENNRTSVVVRPYKTYEKVAYSMEKRMFKRRLDHLSIEEKILRKKLKNREAAQTSRDKKKARMEELEASILQLQNENESLHEEVRSLKDDKESLMRENARLSEEVWKLSVTGGTCGPAESSPLPKELCPPAALHSPPIPTLLQLLMLLLSVSTTATGTGSTNAPSLLSLRNLNGSRIRSLLKLVIQKRQKQRKKGWWGRQQRAWNPVGLV